MLRGWSREMVRGLVSPTPFMESCVRAMKGNLENFRNQDDQVSKAIRAIIAINNQGSQALLAKFADIVDLKDGLMNNRVCTVKFLVVESYFSCNTTQC